MKTYKVFRSPDSTMYQAVKTGFNWPACLFTYLWMGVKKVPRFGFPAFWSSSLGLIALFVFGAAKSFWNVPTVVHFLFLLAYITYGVFVGKRASEWLAYDKELAGWDYAAMIDADSEYNAIQAAKQ